MSKFDKVEKGTKLIITPDGARILSERFKFKAGQIGYFEGFKSGSSEIIRVRIDGKKDYQFYSDTFWRVWTQPS